MNFARRLVFYIGGFIIGLILLFFFLGGKKTSCDYGPEARTLKNIRIKPRYFSNNVLSKLKEKGLDTSSVTVLLKSGDVLFSESNTDLDSCKIYVIQGVAFKRKCKMKVENCNDKATILELQVN
ncbi:hypothetical protein BXY75_1342 [Ulvibacter antarcticus]|uniref:DUF4258 domain-containing protein n=1 Tax=Ulvibacter antarcticus TaxID=442714 RepID=A0A3L9YUX6_9FLAO|nr:hypothetical protein BXY75_1342 [Ulvibacter antarcticus]